MKRLVFALVFVFPSFFASCQCSNKPDIGPVENEASVMSSGAHTLS